ncbi:hypothetical protein ABIC60_004046 [Phyllobacterium ifriqiyense]
MAVASVTKAGSLQSTLSLMVSPVELRTMQMQSTNLIMEPSELVEGRTTHNIQSEQVSRLGSK